MKAKPTAPAPALHLGAAFTVPQCAQYLGFAMSRMRRLIAARKIRVLRPGTQSIVIYQAWADEFIRKYQQPPRDDARDVAQAALTPQPMPALRGIEDLPGAHRFPSSKAS